MINPFYTVIEVQGNNGNISYLNDHYDSSDGAYAKLYSVLASAAVSQLEYHAGFLIASNGAIIEGKVFDRRESKTIFYTVLEKQFNEGIAGEILTHCNEQNVALSTMYSILASACISQLEYHAAMIIRSDMTVTDGRIFDRRVEPPVPEPEATPVETEGE